MKVYLAGYDGKPRTTKARQLWSWSELALQRMTDHADTRLLYTYAYQDMTGDIAQTYRGNPCFLDSGAFTVATLGRTYDWPGFYEWAARWEHLAALISSPDVIGDGEASCRNAEAMLGHRSWTAKVLPVFHVGSDWQWLDRCLAMSDYIALGGMVPWVRSPKKLGAWLGECFRRIGDRAQVHGFGLTSWRLWRDFPWTSCDSTSWQSAPYFGVMQLFDESEARFVGIDLRSRVDLMANAELIRSYGQDPASLLLRKHRSSESTNVIGAVVASAYSMQRAAKWLERRR